MIGIYTAQQISLQRRTGNNANGEPTYAAAVNCLVRVQKSSILVPGENVILETKLFLNADTSVEVDDLVVMNGQKYHIASVKEAFALNYLHHKEAILRG